MAETTKGIYYPSDYASVADVPKDMKEMAESIEKVIENEAYDDTKIQQDISELKQKNAKQDTSIEELKAENERLNNDINAISVTEKAEGENITLNDTAEARFKKFGIGGNSWQKTREGYNVLKNELTSQTINGLTFTKQDDGTVTVNGTATADGAYSLATFNAKTGTYTLSGTPTTAKNTYNLCFGSSTYQDIGAGISRTFEEETDVSVYIRILAGQVLSNVVFKPMIVSGTEAKTYEQYGAMPSPEFISLIRNCGDNVNLYDGNEVNSSKTYNSQLCSAKNSIWCTNVDISKLKFPMTFSTNITVNNGNYTSSNIRISLRNANKEDIKLKQGNNSTSSNRKSSVTVLEDDITSDMKYIFVSVRIQDGGYTENTKIEQGTKATSYSPYGQGNVDFKITNGLEDTDTNYQSQSFTFPLAEGQRLMKGDYLADDGIHHKRKQRTFDGTESWHKSPDDQQTDNTNLFYLTLSDKKLGVFNVISNMFPSKYVVDTTNDFIGICGNALYNLIYIRINQQLTLEEFKSLLAEQYANGTPVVVEYDLAEEEIEAYIPEQQTVHNEIKKTAHSYGEQTHIFSTDETSPIFNVEAKKDMNTVISNLESMIISNASEEV